jgi:ComF family protein
MFQLLQRWLLPYHCVLCHHTSDQDRDLCSSCQAALPFLEDCCVQCAAPLPAGSHCGACLKTPPPFDRTFSLFRYEPPINQWITQLKFHRNLRNARLLSELFLEKLSMEEQISIPELIIPVPLHPKRLRERGFNQALELARPLAKQLGTKLDTRRCKRVRHTQAQSSIPAKQREQNLKRAFTYHGPALHHAAIIDDVITTGHTVSELSKTLRQAGCQKIDIWTIARTSRHSAINY